MPRDSTSSAIDALLDEIASGAVAPTPAATPGPTPRTSSVVSTRGEASRPSTAAAPAESGDGSDEEEGEGPSLKELRARLRAHGGPDSAGYAGDVAAPRVQLRPVSAGEGGNGDDEAEATEADAVRAQLRPVSPQPSPPLQHLSVEL